MVRVVFDTVGFVRGLINPKSRWGRILFAHTAAYQLVVSPAIVLEVLEVLRRPEVVRLFSTLPGRNPATIVAMLQTAETVEPAATPQISRDPKDDKFLAAAREAGVDYLVSEDRDLTDLKDYEGIAIVDGAAFLAILEREGGGQEPAE
jgi:putative PIN family toxin of toxin-antitoxin system